MIRPGIYNSYDAADLFMAERATAAATETKMLANRYVRTAEAGSGNGLG